VNELDTHFAEFDGIIEKHNIEKIKTIGDAYLAVGGIPIENKSNPISVVLAGLEIQRYAERINRLQRKLKFPLWELRIGIHTGEVFTGVVGKKKFAFEVLGESVFIASRIEDFCEAGKVTISQATYDQVKDYFECTYAQTVELKNQYPMMIYTVQSIKAEYSIKNEGKVPNNKLFRIIKDLTA
jgi:class 3 adenylate cyclase